ncbi:MAG: pyrroline-5-carboxylate reductase, partial [Dehalococcoidia bacterium]|nr:pyrroline-5-carboxylate reductase [Dehalococcoidia bacterium]
GMLKALGEEIYVKEEKYVDMATAVSGSGPAFMFLIIEALADAGVHIGLPRDTAKILAVQTAFGSSLLVKETGKHTSELREMVSSPGGTTVEGLLELEKGQVKADIINAVTAAYNKSLKLADAASQQNEGKSKE